MADPIGAIRLIAFNPTGDQMSNYLICDGQTYATAQYSQLYDVIGNTFGGNMDQFQVPDLMGKCIIGAAPGFQPYPVNLGQTLGESQVTLQMQNLPDHTHTLNVSNLPGEANSISGLVPAYAQIVSGRGTTPVQLYDTLGNTSEQMAYNTVGPSGGSESHNNMMPYLNMVFVICAKGDSN